MRTQARIAAAYTTSSALATRAPDDKNCGFQKSMNLRPYQSTALHAVRETYREGHRSALVVMPTGTGKTVLFAEIARLAKGHGVDVIDVSSAGNVPTSRPVYGRMYQVPFAERIRFEADVPVMAVGGIQGLDHAHTIVAAGRAGLSRLCSCGGAGRGRSGGAEVRGPAGA